MTNNLLLEKNNIIKTELTDTDDDYPNLIPSHVDLSGSNNMLCSNVYDKLDKWNTTAKLDMTVPVYTKSKNVEKTSEVCPVITATDFYNAPLVCQPDAITNVVAKQTKIPQKYKLNWDKTDHDTWQVSHYQIRLNYDDNDIRTIPNSFVLPLSITNTSQTSAFEVRACTSFVVKDLETCGDWSESNHTQDLGTVTNLTSTWSGSSGNAFVLDFQYPQNLLNQDSSTPDFFKILPDSLELNLTPIPSIVFTNPTIDYTSSVINLDDYLGQEFRVYACKNQEIGQKPECGSSALIRVKPRPIIGTDPSTTIETPTASSVIGSTNSGEISISLYSSDEIDFFEITEVQPVAIINQEPYINVENKKYYSLNAKADGQGSTATLDLLRKVNGAHKFLITACRYITTNGINSSYCSSETSPLEINWDVARDVPDFNQIDTLFTQLKWYDVDCDDGESDCVEPSTTFPQTNQYWKRGILWSFNDTNIDPPDYFYLSKENGSDTGQNVSVSPDWAGNSLDLCVNKQASLYDVNAPGVSINPMYGKQQIVHTIDEGMYGSSIYYTSADCSEGIRYRNDGLWRIQACYSGIGCSTGKTINIGDSEDMSPTNVEPTGNSDGFNLENSPSNLKGGLWWNPHQSGTGWYFYWKNNSSNPDRDLTQNKDLVTYWASYRKVNEEWMPVWLHSTMSLQQSDTNGNLFYKGQIYYSNIQNGQKVEQGVGTIKVRLHEDSNINYKAKIELNVDGTFSDGSGSMITSSGINFDDAGQPETGMDSDEFRIVYNYDQGDIIDSIVIPLEIAGIRLAGGATGPSSPEGLARFGPANDNDHYQGVWQYDDIDDSNDATLALWKIHNLEVANFFVYDNQGQPLWLIAQSCGDPCIDPIPEYFDGYLTDSIDLNFVTNFQGFNPLSYTPLGLNVQTRPVATAGRQFSGFDDLDNYQQAKFWLDINYNQDNVDANLSLGAKQLEDISSDSNPVFNMINTYKVLNKVANINHIGFNVKDSNGLIQYQDVELGTVSKICNPNLIGPCSISFNWYADDATGQNQWLTPYYKHESMEEFAPINSQSAQFSCASNPIASSLEENYICTEPLAGAYEFELRRPNYSGSGFTTIAKSQTLTVIACEDDCSIVPEATEVEDATINVISEKVPNQPGAGPLPGSGGVSGGAATYNVPLFIPPGRNGMTPSVSINYSSKGGNGVMGVGWSASIGSGIYRCSQTKAQDGNGKSVTLDETDRLCLDGQRLMLVNGVNPPNNSSDLNDSDNLYNQSYWIDDAEYRTEQDSFSKISKTSTGFKVQTKSGRTNTYEQLGHDQLSSWQLVMEEDSFGNNIKYTHENFGHNESLVTRIFYTGHNSSTGTREIRFNYIDRITDYNVSYHYGYKTERTQQLESIVTYVPTESRKYEFEYKSSKSNSDLLLDKIYESTGGVQRELLALNWTDDDWSDGEWLDKEESKFVYENIDSEENQILVDSDFKDLLGQAQISYDFNGDGIKDYLAISHGGESRSLFFFDDKNVLKLRLELPTNITFNYSSKVYGAADLTINGYTDLIDSTGLYSWKNNKSLPDSYDSSDTNIDNYFIRSTNTTSTLFTDINARLTEDQDNTHVVDFNRLKLNVLDFDNDGDQDILAFATPKYVNTHMTNICLPDDIPGVAPDFCEIEYAKIILFINTPNCESDSCKPEFNSGSVIIDGLEPQVDREREDDIWTYVWDDLGDIVDYNGDGYMDIFIARWQSAALFDEYDSRIAIENQYIYFTNSSTIDGVKPKRTEFKSLGLTNFTCQEYENSSVIDVNCNIPEDSVVPENKSFHLVDINSDGLQDFVYYDHGESYIKTWKVRLNQGGGTFDANGDFQGILFVDDYVSGISDPENQLVNFNSLDQPSPTEGGSHECFKDPSENYENSKSARKCNPFFRGVKSMQDLDSDGIPELIFPDPDPNVNVASGLPGKPENLVFNYCSTFNLIQSVYALSLIHI